MTTSPSCGFARPWLVLIGLVAAPTLAQPQAQGPAALAMVPSWPRAPEMAVETAVDPQGRTFHVRSVGRWVPRVPGTRSPMRQALEDGHAVCVAHKRVIDPMAVVSAPPSDAMLRRVEEVEVTQTYDGRLGVAERRTVGPLIAQIHPSDCSLRTKTSEQLHVHGADGIVTSIVYVNGIVTSAVALRHAVPKLPGPRVWGPRVEIAGEVGLSGPSTGPFGQGIVWARTADLDLRYLPLLLKSSVPLGTMGHLETVAVSASLSLPPRQRALGVVPPEAVDKLRQSIQRRVDEEGEDDGRGEGGGEGWDRPR